MKSKRNYKNKKFKKTRSKKGAGLFNTQKIVDSAECQPVKQLGNYQNFSADKAFELYNTCCPKSSLTGKANYNFKCKNLYQTYLNKTKQVAPAQPVAHETIDFDHLPGAVPGMRFDIYGRPLRQW